MKKRKINTQPMKPDISNNIYLSVVREIKIVKRYMPGAKPNNSFLKKMIKFLEQLQSLQKEVVTLDITCVQDIFSKQKSGKYISLPKYYSLAKARVPRGGMKKDFLIVDKTMSLSPGEHEFSLIELSSENIKNLPNHNEWYTDTNCIVYEKMPSIDPIKSFKLMKDYGITCEELMVFHLTENCIKDKQILEVDKTIVIPIDGFEVRNIQPMNNHIIKMLGTSVGKSTIALVLGKELLKAPTEAGLLGGNFNDYKNQTRGELSGSGTCFIDELNEEDKPVLLHLLTYMEQGSSTRQLKIPIKCKGTKTLVINGNPMSNLEQLHINFLLFIKSTSGLEFPSRIGRRFGILLLGCDGDHLIVDDTNSVIEHTPLLRRLIASSLELRKERIIKIYQHILPELKQSNESYQKEIKSMASKVKIVQIREFLEGFAISSSKKLKMAALRSAMLQCLDTIVLEKSFRKTVSLLKIKYKQILPTLEEINIRSIIGLTGILSQTDGLKNKDLFKKIYSVYPSESLRFYSMIVGVSHETIRIWKEEIQ